MQFQIIEVAIGLIASFFLVSLIASAFVEIVSIGFRKRSKDLMVVVDEMLSTGSTNAVNLRSTSIYAAMLAASRRKRGPSWLGRTSDRREPSYMSARSFADGVIEGVVKLRTENGTVEQVVESLPDGPLKERIVTLRAEVGDDLVAIKAGLEGWFDDTMDRLEGAYKRWTQWFLLGVGVVLAVALNVSAVRIVDSLWNDAVLRTAVADSAVELAERPCPADQSDCPPEVRIENAIAELDGLSLPVGWTDDWSKQSGQLPTLLGMLMTGAAVMLGAPFWFDLLSRLAGARGNRGAPPRASSDRGSATLELAESRPQNTPRPFFGL